MLVNVKARAIYGSSSVELRARETDLPPCTLTPTDTKQLWEQVIMYCVWLQRKHNVEVTYSKQQVYNAYRASKPLTPNKARERTDLRLFEVNLTTPLEGWKTWELKDGFLHTRDNFVWRPDEAVTARCTACNPTVTEDCSCGIYSADELSTARVYFHVTGKIYGWGRYIRGYVGWRSQFAYPKEFQLDANQIELVDILRKYHVPIYIQEPTLIYSPKEDGYEHRQDETDWSSGTVEESGTEED